MLACPVPIAFLLGLLQTPEPPSRVAMQWPLTTAEWSVSEKHEGPGFGCNVAQVGDLDGDGVGDIVIGSFDRVACMPDIANFGQGHKPFGKLFAYSAKTHARLWTCTWTNHSISFGECLTVIPDQDNDGVSDVAVGLTDFSFSIENLDAPRKSGIALISGRRGSIIRELSNNVGEVLGVWWMPMAGNDNGGDLLCGITEAKGSNGRVMDVSLKSGKPLWQSPAVPGARSFCLLASHAGQQAHEVAVGCPQERGDEHGAEKVVLVSTLTGKITREIAGPPERAHFGTAVCGVADMDGDDLPEIAIGAPSAKDGLNEAGAVYLWTSRDKQLSKPIRGTASGGRFGWRIGSANVLSKPGESMLIVGAVGVLPKEETLGASSLVSLNEAVIIKSTPGDAVWLFSGSRGYTGYARRERPKSDYNASPTIRIFVEH